MNTQQIRAIVLDLDGTLLNSQKTVSKRNLMSILKCHAQGIRIVIATARPPRAVKELLPMELQEIAILATYNGGLIHNEELGINEHKTIPSDVTSEIYDYILNHSGMSSISIELEDTWLSHQELDYMALMNVRRKPKKIDLDEIRFMQATKILITNFLEYKDLIDRFGHKVNVMKTDGGHLIQMMAHGISKKSAVLQICEKLKIPLEHVMSFGDDLNDLDLFEDCGYPIAMGNAVLELKYVAKLVTDTNDRDGVAIILEKIESLCSTQT